jgi:hypothetical protein
MLIEVIKDEEYQVESSFIGLKDVVLSIVADYWLTIREPEILWKMLKLNRLISSRINNTILIVLNDQNN